ncbi:hypothetical protein X797_010456 [Metarhizium robertsii]|uniref:Uncharacterized protein n=1 Tax=Metarhizium robertsii TaxID=568076 RepID=A0A0A1UP48_9HYPO|nr:hypothetical protein X797_010456 [Metarhizium robertsii]
MRLSNLFVFASAATSAIAQYYGDQYDIDSAQYNIDDTEYDGTEFISRPARQSAHTAQAVVYSGKNNQAIMPTGRDEVLTGGQRSDHESREWRIFQDAFVQVFAPMSRLTLIDPARLSRGCVGVDAQ